ncbi:ImmA/IrrE family metallo-endopeptidase [Rhodococcus aetherivorans]|uniref:ImmA/IrrE family metallo-endopeptidase n=1 Tax=Rhodococcus aetherivorans TaxID=191292 RepID=UPI00388F8BF2
MRDLEQMVASAGILILEGELPGGERGRWYADKRVIVLQSGMSITRTRCALCHELGHAFLGHDMSTLDPVIRARQERQADEFAAERLITAESYARAEAIHGAYLPSIANELNVTLAMAEAWRELWIRKGQNGVRSTTTFREMASPVR